MTTTRFARLFAALLAVASLLIATTVANAQQAYISYRTSLRAGPDMGYPQVGWLGSGAVVYVNGCVRGYYWCDVSAGPSRGWVSARHLQYVYQNRRVGIYGNGGAYGFPVTGFVLGSYWDNHYRGQSWYNNRSRWDGWRPGSPAPRFEGHGPQHFAPAPHAGFAPPQAAYPQHQRSVAVQPVQPVYPQHQRSVAVQPSHPQVQAAPNRAVPPAHTQHRPQP